MPRHTLTVGFLVILWIWLAPLRLQAGITYDAAANAVRVVNYPAAWPCTPARLWTVDQQHGWGKVASTPAN